MSKKYNLLFICGLILTFLSGCWDQVEIEKRGFVVSSAIDLKDNASGIGEEIKLILTNQMVSPAGLGSPTQKGGGANKAFINVSSSGESIFAINREMSTKTSRSPFYPHLKLIIISEEVAKVPYLFGQSIDLFIRDHEMRRGVNVVIAEGKAKDILNAAHGMEKLPTPFIESIIQNAHKTAATLEPKRIGTIHGFLLRDSSFAIQKLSFKNNKVKNEGAAVFLGHNNKMVGTLNETETKGLNFITGEIKSGAIKTKVKEELLVYEIGNAKSSIKVTKKGKKNFDFSVSIVTEGKVAETFGSQSFLKQKNAEKIEAAVSKEIERIVNQAIEKIQGELKIDVFGFDDKLIRKHYDTWEKIKEDWDHGENYFSKSNINVSVKTFIRSTGSADKTKRNE